MITHKVPESRPRSYYFILQIKISDPGEYKLYLDRSGDVFKKYKGEYILVDDDPVVVEGKWDCTRTVLIRFSNKSEFWEWYYSEEYQEILKYRLNAAECNAVLAEGISPRND